MVERLKILENELSSGSVGSSDPRMEGKNIQTDLKLSAIKDRDVFIIGFGRTPLGSFNGELSSLSAIDLCVASNKHALAMAQIHSSCIQEVFIGNVISAGLGQAPAKQIAIHVLLITHKMRFINSQESEIACLVH